MEKNLKRLDLVFAIQVNNNSAKACSPITVDNRTSKHKPNIRTKSILKYRGRKHCKYKSSMQSHGGRNSAIISGSGKIDKIKVIGIISKMRAKTVVMPTPP
jgi:hypothetical protein